MAPRIDAGPAAASDAALARVDASLLSRSLLVLAGLLGGATVVWSETQSVRPLWWSAGWQLGYGQMVLSTTVLVATQLAAGRAWRDDVRDLYATFPTPAGTRTYAQLLAAIGALPASLLLVAAAAGAFELRGAIGTPSTAVLAGGSLLVLAGATIGVAVGVRFPHPIAGVVAALVWFGAFSQTNRFNSGVAWLPPWGFAGTLRQLPGPLPGYPPATAHATELAAIVVLSGAVALALTGGRRWQRARAVVVGAVVVGAAALTVGCLAAAVQLRPVGTATLDRLAEAVATPAAVQRCTTTDRVRYCLYPGFESLLPALRGPVSGVLAHLPARPAQPLTVQQVAEVNFDDPTLTYGHAKQQIAAWVAQTQASPGNSPSASAIYPVVGWWPAGARLAAAQFDLALGAAEWAVGLPPTAGQPSGPASPQCVPVDQAREAVAIWLAIVATHSSTSSLQVGLPGPGQAGSDTLVRGAVVATWTYPGEFGGYLASPGPQPTADGYLLGQAMAGLPTQQVQHILDQGWARWLDPHTGDAALAAALDSHAPTLPTPPLIEANPPTQQQPACTT